MIENKGVPARFLLYAFLLGYLVHFTSSHLNKPSVSLVSSCAVGQSVTWTGKEWECITQYTGTLTISGSEANDWAGYYQEQVRLAEAWKSRPHLNAPSDAPPRKIKVGKTVYTVHYTSYSALESQNALALTDLDKRSIWLNPKRTKDLRDDLLHELFHCAYHESSNKDWWGYAEETYIQETSPQVLAIIRDNPELMEWLRK